MHPFDAAASLLSATPAEGSFEPPQQQEGDLGGAASSPPSPSRATRDDAGENAGVTRCPRAKACCAHGCSDRRPGGHVNTSVHVPASSSQCSERQQQMLAALDVEPIPNKRPRRPALPSVAAAAAAAAATSSVDQPIATTTALEGFAREVSMDAVFRRVRLAGGPAAELEVAYHTTVTIAGHVFRGILYDVGPGAGAHSGSSSTDTDAASDNTDGSGEVGSSLSTAGGSSCCCLDLALGRL